MGLLDFIVKKDDGRKRLHLVDMPALVLVDSVETAYSLEQRLNPSQYLVIHAPDIVAEHGRNHTIQGKKVFADFIGKDKVQVSMTRLYRSHGNIKQSLNSLEERITESQAAKTANMERLRMAVEHLPVTGGAQSSAEVMQLIQELTTLYEYPEHFIVEAVQNADGAAEDKQKNRIDVYIDRANNLVRIEDVGRGMSQQVIDNVFFNLYSSLNEALQHAPGKFGVGRVSFFGMKHEYVKVDSRPLTGEGGVVVVDSDLMRETEFQPTQRTAGTAIEIKFSPDSISFDRVEQMLMDDCKYIRTPLFLHTDGATRQMNEPLERNSDKNTVYFNEPNLEGFVMRIEGEGRLDLLDHYIRLQSIPTHGYSGVVNCAGFETTLGRDTVIDDPVLIEALRFIDMTAQQLRVGSARKQSLEEALADYNDFIHSTLLTKDGKVNDEWVRTHIGVFDRKAALINEEPISILQKLLASPVLFPLALYKYIRQEGERESFKDVFGRYTNRESVSIATSGAIVGGLVMGASALGIALTTDLNTQLRPALNIALTPAYVNTFHLMISYPILELKRHIVNKYYSRMTEEHYPSMLERFIRFTRQNIKPMAIGTGAGILLALSLIPTARAITPLFSLERAAHRAYTQEELQGIVRSYINGEELTREELVTVNSIPRDNSGYVAHERVNTVNLENRTIEWSASEPKGSLHIFGTTAAKMPPELASGELEMLVEETATYKKTVATLVYVQGTFEYDVIPKKTAQRYPDLLAAIIGEKNAACVGGNTAAAWMLYQLGVTDITAVRGTLDGIPHLWLEINEGTAEKPSIIMADFTPRRPSEEYAKRAREANDAQDVPGWLLTLATAASAARTALPYVLIAGSTGITAGIIANKRSKHRPFTALNETQQRVLEQIQDAMRQYGAKAYYGRGMNETDAAFDITKSAVILNRTRPVVEPCIVQLAYVTKVLKDARQAQEISQRILT